METLARFFNSISTAIVLGVIGAAVGALIIFLPFDKGLVVKQTPEFFSWCFLNCTNFAVVAIVVIPLWRSIIELRHHFVRNWAMIVVSLVFILGAYSIIYFISPLLIKNTPEPLLEFGITYKTPFITAIPVIFIGLPVVTGILLIQAAVKEKLGIMQRDQDNRNSKSYIQWFLEKWNLLQRFLVMVGIILSLGILATGALNTLHKAVGANLPLTDIEIVYGFSTDIVLVYGAFLTLILAIVYIPAYLLLIEFGHKLTDKIFELPSPVSDSWMDIVSKRKTLEELLQLRIGAGQNIRSSVAIVAPLFGGIITRLIG